jgi:outer membrane lipoprotein SlyB
MVIESTFVHTKRKPAAFHPMGMKCNSADARKLLAALSVAAGLAACATPYAPRDFDFSELRGLGNTALGTVESVRPVKLERDIHAFEESVELRLRPDLADELVILLDNGRVMTVVAQGTQRFTAGERVRVVSHAYSPYGPQVEHE